LTFRILIDRKTLETIRSFRPKSQRIIMDKLKSLREDPFPGSGGDRERLHVKGREDIFRLHIGHSFTAFYRIHEPKKEVHILAVMSTEQAHKRYGRF
jgi:mRNA interferase RelE/StbE